MSHEQRPFEDRQDPIPIEEQQNPIPPHVQREEDVPSDHQDHNNLSTDDDDTNVMNEACFQKQERALRAVSKDLARANKEFDALRVKCEDGTLFNNGWDARHVYAMVKRDLEMLVDDVEEVQEKAQGEVARLRTATESQRNSIWIGKMETIQHRCKEVRDAMYQYGNNFFDVVESRRVASQQHAGLMAVQSPTHGPQLTSNLCQNMSNLQPFGLPYPASAEIFHTPAAQNQNAFGFSTSKKNLHGNVVDAGATPRSRFSNDHDLLSGNAIVQRNNHGPQSMQMQEKSVHFAVNNSPNDDSPQVRNLNVHSSNIGDTQQSTENFFRRNTFPREPMQQNVPHFPLPNYNKFQPQSIHSSHQSYSSVYLEPRVGPLRLSADRRLQYELDRHLFVPQERQFNPANHARFPSLEIPKFNGSADSWRSFWSAFSTLVHSNSSINEDLKSLYLRSCLTDAAAQSVLPVLDRTDGYQAAITMLLHRYQIIPHGHSEIMQGIIVEPQITKMSLSGITSMITFLRPRLRELAEIDPGLYTALFFRDLIRSKFPRELKKDIEDEERRLGYEYEPLQFLQIAEQLNYRFARVQQAQRLEKITIVQSTESVRSVPSQSSGKKTYGTRPGIKRHVPFRQAGTFACHDAGSEANSEVVEYCSEHEDADIEPTDEQSEGEDTAVAFAANTHSNHKNTSDKNCFVCKQSDHKARQCPIQVGPEVRLQFAKLDHRCLVCFSKAHKSEECKSGSTCAKCGSKKHTAIVCVEKTKERDFPKGPPSAKKE